MFFYYYFWLLSHFFIVGVVIILKLYENNSEKIYNQFFLKILPCWFYFKKLLTQQLE